MFYLIKQLFQSCLQFHAPSTRCPHRPVIFFDNSSPAAHSTRPSNCITRHFHYLWCNYPRGPWTIKIHYSFQIIQDCWTHWDHFRIRHSLPCVHIWRDLCILAGNMLRGQPPASAIALSGYICSVRRQRGFNLWATGGPFSVIRGDLISDAASGRLSPVIHNQLWADAKAIPALCHAIPAARVQRLFEKPRLPGSGVCENHQAAD